MTNLSKIEIIIELRDEVMIIPNFRMGVSTFLFWHSLTTKSLPRHRIEMSIRIRMKET